MAINNLRKKIDEIDEKIISLLERRYHLSQKILQEKIRKGIDLTDRKREKEIIENLKKKARNKTFSFLIEKIYPIIFDFNKKIALLKKVK